MEKMVEMDLLLVPLGHPVMEEPAAMAAVEPEPESVRPVEQVEQADLRSPAQHNPVIMSRGPETEMPDLRELPRILWELCIYRMD